MAASAVGIGPAATDDDDQVLVKVKAIERTDQFHLLVERRGQIGEPGR
jgi:hypothetical protein